jgi:hypothetical protein
MGQLHSTQNGRYSSLEDDVSSDNPLLKDLDEQIKRMRVKLYQTKAEGITQRDKQGQEIYDLEMALYKKRTQLMNMGRSCQDAFSFSEYINIIQRTYTSSKIPLRPVKSVFREDGEKATTTDIVPQYFTLSYTIFAWLEAYLLKRLHLAMLQQNQKHIHSKTWSGVVADMYFVIPVLKKNFEKKLGRLFLRKQNVEIEKHQKQDAYADHVRLQEKTIMKLEQASWDDESEINTALGYLQFDVTSGEATSDIMRKQNTASKKLEGTEEQGAVKKCETDATADLSSSIDSGKDPVTDSSESASDISGAEQELALQINTINESYEAKTGVQDRSSNESEPSSSETGSDEYESDITDSGSDVTDDDDRPTAVSVQALNVAVEKGISSLPVSGDFDWRAGIEQELEQERIHMDRDMARLEIEKMLVKHSAEEREEERLKAEMENARLEAKRMVRRSKELKAKHAEESARLETERMETEREQKRLSEFAEKTLLAAERIKKEEVAKQAKDMERENRATFKAQRLKDLQSRLHQTISISPVKFPIKSPGQGSEATRSPVEIRISGNPLDVKAKDDPSTKSDTSSMKQRKQLRSHSLLAAETRAREKIEALNRTILPPEEIRISGNPLDIKAKDDPSTKSDTSSMKQRKQLRSQSLLVAETRAREKIEALNRTILLGDLNEDIGDSTKHSNSTNLDTDKAEGMAVGPDARKKAKELAEQKLEVLQVDKLEKSPIEPKSIEGAAESYVIDEEEVETEEQIRQIIRKEVLEETARSKELRKEESLEDNKSQIEGFTSALENLRGSMTKLGRLSFSQEDVSAHQDREAEV